MILRDAKRAAARRDHVEHLGQDQAVDDVADDLDLFDVGLVGSRLADDWRGLFIIQEAPATPGRRPTRRGETRVSDPASKLLTTHGRGQGDWSATARREGVPRAVRLFGQPESLIL